MAQTVDNGLEVVLPFEAHPGRTLTLLLFTDVKNAKLVWGLCMEGLRVPVLHAHSGLACLLLLPAPHMRANTLHPMHACALAETSGRW